MIAKPKIYKVNTYMLLTRSLPCRYRGLVCQSILECAINEYANNNDFKLHEFVKDFPTGKKAR